MRSLSKNLKYYMSTAAEERFTAQRFVEHGGRMLNHSDQLFLSTQRLDSLLDQTRLLSAQKRQFAENQELLIHAFYTDSDEFSDDCRREICFALLFSSMYLEKPFHPFDAGSPSEADVLAVVEAVLERHNEAFGAYCERHLIPWNNAIAR